jgi:peptidoglycan/xylan/chitin deacetylase (PgdA/CDA1 family)
MPDEALTRPAAAGRPGKHSPPARPWWRRVVDTGLSACDALCHRLTPASVRDAPALLVFALHALCGTRAGVHDPVLATGQAVCVDDLRALVETVLAHGYRLVSPDDLAGGLDPAGNYAMLTFDDGYFNNVLALPVLDEFDVPATFFIASNCMLEGNAFWWDVVSRELERAGASAAEGRAELARLKALHPTSIEPAVRQRYGAEALRPRGDADRPFTPAELRDFARHRNVHVGNHTADHAILTHCTPQEARSQIDRCQDELRAITGRAPLAISYPNGNHSEAVVEAARAAGLRLGFTVQPGRNSAAPEAAAQMRLSRFYFHGRPDAASEFQACRGGFVPSRVLRSVLQPA